MSGILIQGDGVAAWCCSLLLRRAGFDVCLKSQSRVRLPAVMLSDAAVALIRDVFERADLFHAAPRIMKRIVRWGPGANPVALDHAAVVVSEQELMDALGTPVSDDNPEPPPDWTVVASRPLPPNTIENRFGNRFATAIPVELNANAEPEACWMESLPAGWLFLITCAPGAGWMLSVGAPTEELLAQSTLIAPQIARCGPSTGTFASAPRIISPLGGPGWLACGTAALTFDPICGDGTANAIREAILGAAVIAASRNGCDATSLLAHYEGRLTAGFRRHLEICLGFYRSGGAGEWWQNNALALRNGIEWCDARLAAGQAFQYRLAGFRLESINPDTSSTP
jgi:hypothetical protein